MPKKKRGQNRRSEIERAKKLAAQQSRGMTARQRAAIEKAFLDPHVAGITSATPKVEIVKTRGDMIELSEDQHWVKGAFERGETIIKISISTKYTRKKFAIRG